MDNLLIFISNAIIQTFLCGYTVYSISKFFVSEPFSKKQNILLIITSLLGVTFSLIVKEYIPAFNIMTCIVVFVLISHFVLKITWLKSLLIAVLSMTYTAITEIICFFIGMIIFKADVAELTNQPLISIALSLLQFILICIFLFVYLKKSVEHEKTQSDLFTSELHNKTLVGMVDGVRTLKHDYNNIMQALNGYVSTKQYDKLQNHINGVLEECNIVNSLAVIDPKIFNDPAIYGIVGSKFFLANEQNLPFEFDIVTNIAEIQFPMPDLSRILGILLDNAMEATKKAKKPLIRLEMKFDKRKCADVIRVVNTYDTSINIDLEAIYKKGFSTKKVKSGIGLWEVKKLVSKVRNAQVYATIENDKFVQNLIIEKID